MLNMEQCNTTDPRKFWDYVKRLGPSKHNNIPWEVNIDGEVVTDKELVLDKWRNDFESLYKITESGYDNEFRATKVSEFNELRMKVNNSIEELDRALTYTEVEHAIKKSKDKKAIGIDLIPNELLKNPSVMKLIHKFFVVCWNHELVSGAWCKAIIHPIPKTTSRTVDPLKYRGLALQSCVYKVLSNLINNRVINFLEGWHVIAEEQNGFRKQRSCLHHIHSLRSILQTRQLTGISTHTCFIDFQKAFDVTDRSLMYYCLVQCGIRGKILSMIEQFYKYTENTIRLNGFMSSTFCSENGLRQGDNLSPTLFGLYVNRLIKG